jgi:predicted DNA-binding transcriptional regulator AlpA
MALTKRKDPLADRMPLVLRKKQVVSMIGISASTLYDLQKSGKFPLPIHLTGKRTNGWLTKDVEEWIAQRAAERVA